jgi:CheY-like chemotaxis protein
LSASITATIKMLKRLVGEQIDMRFAMAPQPVFLHADPSMIDQVVLNLVLNACDAMPDGGKLVITTASVRIDAPGKRAGTYVCLSVRDSGCGIAPEILPSIFEPFFTTKETGKGTGLGLATVFGIVQQHEGWIDVDSAVGRGTEFRLYLPQLAQQPHHARPRAAPPARRAVAGGSETILLAEDDPMLRAAVRTTLSRLGYHVMDAANGAAALGIWNQQRDEIRLLLTDQVMPGGMTGTNLAARILRENPALKVIYMSGYSDEAFPQDGGAFIAKPFESYRLAAAVRQCLDGG